MSDITITLTLDEVETLMYALGVAECEDVSVDPEEALWLKLKQVKDGNNACKC